MPELLPSLHYARAGLSRCLPGLALAIALATAWSSPGAAQTQSTQPAQPPGPPPQVFGDWFLPCEPAPQEGSGPRCVLLQNVINQENQQPLMQVAVGFYGRDRQRVVVIKLPLGVTLPPGIQMRIDESPAAAVPFQICRPDGCQAFIPLDEKLLAAMKAGIGGTVSFRDAGNRPVQLPVSLKGFTAGFAEVK